MRVVALFALYGSGFFGCSSKDKAGAAAPVGAAAEGGSGGLSPDYSPGLVASYQTELSQLEDSALKKINEQQSRKDVEAVRASTMDAAAFILDRAVLSGSVTAAGMRQLQIRKDALAKRIQDRGDERSALFTTVFDLERDINAALVSFGELIKDDSVDQDNAKKGAISYLRTMVNVKSAHLPKRVSLLLAMKVVYVGLLMDPFVSGPDRPPSPNAIDFIYDEHPLDVAEQCVALIAGKAFAKLSTLSVTESIAAADALEKDLNGLRQFLSEEDEEKIKAGVADVETAIVGALADHLLTTITLLAELKTLVRRMDEPGESQWAAALDKFKVKRMEGPTEFEPFGAVIRRRLAERSSL